MFGKYISNLLLVVVFTMIITGDLMAQSNRWKRSRYELTGGFGITNFFGELGGADKPGSKYFTDYDFNSSRPALSVGFRYKVLEMVNAHAHLSYGVVHGSDANTENIYRRDRNLHFRSTIIEFNTVAEISIINEKLTHKYNLKRRSGFSLKNLNTNLYVFMGYGFFYFNPKAKYNGKWVALQPLGTEGQGLMETRQKYKRVSACIPFGFGFRYFINRYWGIGIEYGGRYTYTDYIDDVSTTYVNNQWLRNERGNEAADLADPSFIDGENLIGQPYGGGDQRGNPKYDDFYMFTQITVSYKLRTGRTGLPKF